LFIVFLRNVGFDNLPGFSQTYPHLGYRPLHQLCQFCSQILLI